MSVLSPVRASQDHCLRSFGPPPYASAGCRDSVSGMTKWEYASVPLLIHATKQILDQWGEDGWELVTVLPNPSGEQHVAYLKREKEA